MVQRTPREETMGYGPVGGLRWKKCCMKLIGSREMSESRFDIVGSAVLHKLPFSRLILR